MKDHHAKEKEHRAKDVKVTRRATISDEDDSFGYYEEDDNESTQMEATDNSKIKKQKTDLDGKMR